MTAAVMIVLLASAGPPKKRHKTGKREEAEEGQGRPVWLPMPGSAWMGSAVAFAVEVHAAFLPCASPVGLGKHLACVLGLPEFDCEGLIAAERRAALPQPAWGSWVPQAHCVCRYC